MKSALIFVATILFQLAVTWGVILASRGNGSFVGLGAMLLAVMGIPVTAIVNLALVLAARTVPPKPWLAKVVFVTLILPAAQLALLLLVYVFRL